MDRHPQQLKRERQDKKRRARNVENLSKLRTFIKKLCHLHLRKMLNQFIEILLELLIRQSVET